MAFSTLPALLLGSWNRSRRDSARQPISLNPFALQQGRDNATFCFLASISEKYMDNDAVRMVFWSRVDHRLRKAGVNGEQREQDC